tara:strand:- start:592 stop:1122 length:531 start_codon:yes stop_codon:yes gene_type:complete
MVEAAELEGALEAASSTASAAEGVLASAEELAGAAEAEVAVERGRLREESSLDEIEHRTKRRLYSRNDTLYKKCVSRAHGRDIILVGRTDGSDGSRVIEVKERRNRLFKKVVSYERVQVLAYMYLTDTTSALLKERYDEDSREYNIDFDSSLWASCVSKLTRFVSSQLEASRIEEC